MSDAYRAVERALLARTPESNPGPSLDRIRALLDLLGDPQDLYPFVHVTGTNGKTSTARLIESLLSGFGMRVGRYTSPHLQSMRERISIDGHPLDEEQFVAAYEDVAPYFAMVDAQSDVPLSFFEALTGMAYAAFADAPVHGAVIEVGLGGSWDATNAADGSVAVITPISLDHTELLGDSVADIAREKAGIIKPGGFAVLAQQPIDAAEVLLAHAAQVETTVAREGFEFGVLHREIAVGGQVVTLQGLGGEYDDLFLPLHGAHQAHNAAVALAAAEAFLGGGRERLDLDMVRAAFADVRTPGRLEVVKRSPSVIVDAAHNPAGADVLAEALGEAFTFDRLIGVVGVMVDKDAYGILAALEPVLTEVVITRSSSVRAMPVAELAEVAHGIFGAGRVTTEPTLPQALDTAVALAEAEGDVGGIGVVVTGSVVTAGEARLLLGGDPQ